LILRRSGKDYDWLVREMPTLYKLEYEVSDLGPTSVMVHNTMAAMLFEVMGDLIRQYKPDAIVTPYPFYQAPLAAVFTLTQCDIPLFTVVTDLAPVHRIWFHKAATMCLVSAPSVRQQALECGLSPDKVVVTGIPVHPNLAHEERSKTAIRTRLGWSPDLTTILAVGSKRVKNLPGILRTLNHSGLPIQVVIVTGGDDASFQHFQETEWHIPVHLYNFVDNMPTLMHAADGIICKAGGLIVTESLACGLPILLTDVIEGQETSNANYVVNGGAGELVRSPLEGLEAIFHWLMDGCKLLELRSENAKRLGYPRSAYDVADLVWKAALVGPHYRSEHRLPEKIEKIVKELKDNPPLLHH